MARYDRLIEALEALPDARRDEIVELALALADGDEEELGLDDAQVAEIRRRLVEPGRIATDEEVEAIFAKYGA